LENCEIIGGVARQKGAERSAYFVCVIAVAQMGRVIAVVSDKVDGEIAEAPRGSGGFGYDPVFYFPALGKRLRNCPRMRRMPGATAAKRFTG